MAAAHRLGGRSSRAPNSLINRVGQCFGDHGEHQEAGLGRADNLEGRQHQEAVEGEESSRSTSKGVAPEAAVVEFLAGAGWFYCNLMGCDLGLFSTNCSPQQEAE
jgi:hypothetical protein